MTWENVSEKRVFFCEKHQEVLAAWVEVYREAGVPLVLVTFDHHVDLRDAFQNFAYHKLLGKGEEQDLKRERAARVASIDISCDESISKAIKQLKHDEHIDCAIRLGVFSKVFVSLGWDKVNFNHPGAELFNYEPCWSGCEKNIHDDECNDRRADLVIDDSTLRERLEKLENAVGSLDRVNYILDIDLDVFSTFGSIEPNRCDAFHKIIRYSKAITVARETAFVEDPEHACQRDEGLTVAFIEPKLRAHIMAASS